MIVAPKPENEAQRLVELRALKILDTLPEQAFDDITFLAAQITRSPIALVSLVDADRQWFKSRLGIDAEETHRDLAFCAHAINTPDEVLVVPDARDDARFFDNPLVTDDPSIRFYAGAPLVSDTGSALGTICVIDRTPRELTTEQLEALRALSRQVMSQLVLRMLIQDLEEHAEERRRYEERLEEYQRLLEENLEAVAEQSVTDPLTGLGNRRALMDRLDAEIRRHERYGAPVSLAMIDVDHFKALNDELGHPAGDETLRQLADVLREQTRSADFPARYGGEEFAVILTETDDRGSFVLAERMRKAVERSSWKERPITVSVGVATVDDDVKDAPALVAAADAALYEAKQSGRNRVVCAETT